MSGSLYSHPSAYIHLNLCPVIYTDYIVNIYPNKKLYSVIDCWLNAYGLESDRDSTASYHLAALILLYAPMPQVYLLHLYEVGNNRTTSQD